MADAARLLKPHPRALILPGPGVALYSEARFERRRELPLARHTVTLDRPDDYAAALRVDDETFRRFLESLELGDPLAITMHRRVVVTRRRAGASFSPYTDTYNSGSGTGTTPSGANRSDVTSWGGGGSGRKNITAGGMYGGGAGARCFSTKTVASGDSLGYAVGGGGASQVNNSTNGLGGVASITSSGTGGFSGLAHSAGPGAGGTSSTGTGGTASGGDTNTSGGNGSSGFSGFGGDAPGFSNGGANDTGGDDAQNGGAPGGGGGGCNNASTASGAGAAGRTTFYWYAV